MFVPPWIGRALRLLAHLVPRGERDDWVREWRAELGREVLGAGTDARREPGVSGRLAAAAEDAVRLRLRRLAVLRPAAALRDARFAIRALSGTPLFTLGVAATLSLGVGANAAMFTVVDAVLLDPLPYPEADRLVHVRTVWMPEGNVGSTVSTADYDDLVERSRSVEHLSLRAQWSMTYQADEPIRMEVAGVSSGFFRLFGTSPQLGRYFAPEEDVPGHEPSVVLSHGLWQRVFGGDTEVVGASITLDGRPYVVVGVAEERFRDPVADIELWTSRPGWIDASERNQPWLMVFGRLGRDATLDDARAELASIAGDLALEHPEANADHTLTAVSIAGSLAAPVRPALLVLAAVVGLVLLITCANVVNLILVRAAGREREMAVRISLGAGRARLAGQLLVEGLLIALLGGAGGVGLAVGATRAYAALGAPGLPRLAELQVDGTVLFFTLLVSGATGVVFGLVPLLQVSGADPSRSLRESGRGGEGRRVRRVRRVLVVGELAASAVLLVGTGLLVRSLARLTRVETGVRAEGVVVFQVAPPHAAAPTPATGAELRVFYEGVRSRISRLQGVEAVGGVNTLPFTYRRMYGFTRDDRPGEEPMLAELRIVEPAYFESLGIPLVEGRLLDESDGADAAPALLMDEALARRYFPGEAPIGRRITVHWGAAAGAEPVSYEVVGIVGNVRYEGPAVPPAPTLYTLRGHDATPYWENFALWMTVKTAGDPLDAARAAMQAVWDVDRTVPITQVGTLGDLLGSHSAGTRHQTLLIGAFALLATLLASVGIAGVVAYAVAQRGHELGVRQALGADAGDVVRLVLGEGARLVAVGVGCGLLLAAAGARALRSLLFGVEAGDPLTYAAVGLGLALVALLAAWVPARRAAGVRPAAALRSDT